MRPASPRAHRNPPRRGHANVPSARLRRVIVEGCSRTPARSIPAEESVSYPTVPVGPFRLLDLDKTALVVAIADTAVAQHGTKPTVAFACHDRAFVHAMHRADLAYADGVSVIALMKLAGAKSVERHPTTDLGWETFEALTERLGRPARVALLGGPEGLAARAGEVIAKEAPVEVVLVEHGYHKD